MQSTASLAHLEASSRAQCGCSATDPMQWEDYAVCSVCDLLMSPTQRGLVDSSRSRCSVGGSPSRKHCSMIKDATLQDGTDLPSNVSAKFGLRSRVCLIRVQAPDVGQSHFNLQRPAIWNSGFNRRLQWNGKPRGRRVGWNMRSGLTYSCFLLILI